MPGQARHGAARHGAAPNCQEQGGRGTQERWMALPEAELVRPTRGSRAALLRVWWGGESSRKPSPFRTPEGVARCHYRILVPMALLPETATI